MADQNAEQRMWQTSLYLLGELSPEECLRYEQQLELDEFLCDELVLGARLLQATRVAFPDGTAPAVSVPAVSVEGNCDTSVALGSSVAVRSSVSGISSNSRKAAVFSAVAALGLLFAVFVTPEGLRQPSADVLQDAVALSDILGQWEPEVVRDADWEGDSEDRIIMPENPDWLITAVDLDEQLGESGATTDEEDEAVF